MRPRSNGFQSFIALGTSVQFVSNIKIKRKGFRKMCGSSINLLGGWKVRMGAVALYLEMLIGVDARAIQPGIGFVQRRVCSFIEPAHHLVAHQRSSNTGSGIPHRAGPERPERKLCS